MSSAMIRVFALTENPLSSPRTASSEVCLHGQLWAGLSPPCHQSCSHPILNTRFPNLCWLPVQVPWVTAEPRQKTRDLRRCKPNPKTSLHPESSLGTTQGLWPSHPPAQIQSGWTLPVPFIAMSCLFHRVEMCPSVLCKQFSAWSHQSIPLLVQGLTQLSHASAVIKKSHKRDLPMHLGSLSPALASQGATKYMAL